MTKKSKIIIISIAIFILLVSLAGWIAGSVWLIKKIKNDGWSNTNVNKPVQVYDSLEKFSDKEFNHYLQKLEEKNKASKNSGYLQGLGVADFAEGSAMTESAAPSVAKDAESITNTQETGVDEGDIIKAYGDYLVILSRGRLFSVKIKEGEEKLLKPIFKGAAYPEGFTKGTWFDELLIDNNQIVVIGYTYELSATEIGLFTISDEGIITHQATYFVDSNDYYSSRNYASRLVDGKLIFYMPYNFGSWDYEEDRASYDLPEIKKWIKNDEVTAGEAILDKSDIYKPIENQNATTLHTVVTCDLQDVNFNCSGKAVLGSAGRTFYVSTNAVYIWVSTYDYYSSNTNNSKLKPSSYVYTMSLTDDSAKVLRAYGAPIDQFSFKETPDGYLNVLVQQEGFGDSMFNAEYSDSNIALARFPLTKFSSEPDVLEKSYYQVLPRPEGYTIQNRFVGDYLLYGSGSSWWSDTTAENIVYILPYVQKSQVQKIVLDNTVDRIEVLDNDNAVVVGGKGTDLLFNWLTLDAKDSAVVDTYTQTNASQGETRSHGFFYSFDQNILGLPVRESLEEGYMQLIEESAKIVYLSLDREKKEFIDLGTLNAVSESGYVNDNCLYSCTDWYGNSRPIFYDNRFFALLGYELVEGNKFNNTIQESKRVNFYKDSR